MTVFTLGGPEFKSTRMVGFHLHSDHLYTVSRVAFAGKPHARSIVRASSRNNTCPCYFYYYSVSRNHGEQRKSVKDNSIAAAVWKVAGFVCDEDTRRDVRERKISRVANRHILFLNG